MKKHCILPLLCAFLLLSGCIMRSDDSSHEVSIKIKESAVTSMGLTYLISNQSEYELTYGSPFILEMYRDGKWNELDYANGEPLWAENILSISSGKSAEHSIGWNEIYGSLEDGDYRLNKDFTLDKNNDKVDFQLKVSFNITN